MSGELKMSVVLELIDRISGPAKRVSQALAGIRRASGLDRLGSSMSAIDQRMKTLAGTAGRITRSFSLLGAAAGGLVYLFKRLLIDPAAEFERFEVILKTTEGSAQGARRAMAWISDFATRTPYELAEVVDAFKQLRVYGMDPTNGLLRTLGDTAAAMGKPLMQGVEAVADAVTGEFERLKEFGIKARVVGRRVVFEYTQGGETMSKMADVHNRAMIQSTLEAIWNQKYGGAMADLQTAWDGMMSNLSDQWLRFRLLIMDQGGVFEWLKERLGALLKAVDAMAASGELQKLAESMGGRIVAGLKAAWAAGQEVAVAFRRIAAVVRPVIDAVGGLGNVLTIVAGLMGAKIIVSIAQLIVNLFALGGAVVKFGAVLLTTPVGWFLAALAAIGAAAYLIYKYWEPIKEFFAGLWAGIKDIFKGALDWITGLDRSIRDAALNLLPDFVTRGLGLNVTHHAGGGAPGVRPLPGPVRGMAPGPVQVGGLIRVMIDSEGRPRVQEVTSNNSGVGLDVDTGLVMVFP